MTMVAGEWCGLDRHNGWAFPYERSRRLEQQRYNISAAIAGAVLCGGWACACVYVGGGNPGVNRVHDANTTQCPDCKLIPQECERVEL
jgi:hypothetical protein